MQTSEDNSSVQMRTSAERVKELHRRMESIENTRSRRQFHLMIAAAAAVCLVVLVFVSIGISDLHVRMPGISTISVTASIFAEHAALGYIVVALIAFCLGTAFTVFCYQIKKRKGGEKDNDRKY